MVAATDSAFCRQRIMVTAGATDQKPAIPRTAAAESTESAVGRLIAALDAEVVQVEVVLGQHELVKPVTEADLRRTCCGRWSLVLGPTVRNPRFGNFGLLMSKGLPMMCRSHQCSDGLLLCLTLK